LVGGAVTASCRTDYATTGTRAITASYLGDANFLASDAPVQTVSIRSAPALGTIYSTMQWTFFYTPTYTSVITLRVEGAPIGATVVLTCTGKGCPLHKRTTAVTKPKCKPRAGHPCPSISSKTVPLASAFGKHHLPVGARITVEIIRPRYIGKYYDFTVRSGHGPRIDIDCLAPGGTRPGIGC
jgi:hypothetical protein